MARPSPLAALLLGLALAAGACAGGGSDAPSSSADAGSPTATTGATTTVPVEEPPTTTLALDAVAGTGPPCANVTELDGTVRPVYVWDCPVSAGDWPDADYTVKGRVGVLGWLYEDDPDGLCGVPGAYYQCYDAPMRATLGGVLLSVSQVPVDTPVWVAGEERYRRITQQLWAAAFYLGDDPVSGDPIVGEFLLSLPGLPSDGEPAPSRWRVCLDGNLLAGGDVSCLQAPPRGIDPSRMARGVLEVGRAYAFTVLYTFDPDTVFAGVDERFKQDADAWGSLVDARVGWVSYARSLRDRMQGLAVEPVAGRGMISDIVLSSIPQDAV